MTFIPKVLVVDDDKFLLEFYRTELSKYNINAVFAHDGEEGVERALEVVPDLILLDVMLPKKDGFQVLEELKENEKTKNIPVIIISSLSGESDIDKLLELGAIKTFNKLKFLPKDVCLYVKEILGKKQ